MSETSGITKEAVDQISADLGYVVSDELKFLNYVHIDRNNRQENNFYNIGYILLSGKARINNIAWHKAIKEPGNVPLSTRLDWITNKFWFKLNKGFGEGNKPLSFDRITKAKILLSSLMSETIGNQYTAMLGQYKRGELNDDQVRSRIVRLKSISQTPEDIDQENVGSVLSNISEESLEQYISEQDHLKHKALETEEQKQRLEENLLVKDKELSESQSFHSALQADLLEANERLLSEKRKDLDRLARILDQIEIEYSKKFFNSKFRYVLAIIMVYATTGYFINANGWENIQIGMWAFFVAFPAVVSLITALLFEKTLNPIEFIRKRGLAIRQKVFLKYNCDPDMKPRMEKEITDIEDILK